MKVAKPKVATAATAIPRGLFFAGLLVVVLALLFWKSSLPGYLHFSNDGLLGQQNTAWARLPDAFTGNWGDLNDIGNGTGSLTPDLCSLLRWFLGPVGCSKFLALFVLFILDLGAWTFFRQLRFSMLAASALATERQIELLALRPFHVFGEREEPGRFWPSLRKAALAGEDFRMTAGEQIRDFIPVGKRRTR